MEEMVGMIADNPIYNLNEHIDTHDDLYEDSRQQDYRYKVPKAHSQFLTNDNI